MFTVTASVGATIRVEVSRPEKSLEGMGGLHYATYEARVEA